MCRNWCNCLLVQQNPIFSLCSPPYVPSSDLFSFRITPGRNTSGCSRTFRGSGVSLNPHAPIFSSYFRFSLYFDRQRTYGLCSLSRNTYPSDSPSRQRWRRTNSPAGCSILWMRIHSPRHRPAIWNRCGLSHLILNSIRQLETRFPMLFDVYEHRIR